MMFDSNRPYSCLFKIEKDECIETSPARKKEFIDKLVAKAKEMGVTKDTILRLIYLPFNYRLNRPNSNDKNVSYIGWKSTISNLTKETLNNSCLIDVTYDINSIFAQKLNKDFHLACNANGYK